MTLHSHGNWYSTYQCSVCAAFYIPFAKEIHCPKCGKNEGKACDFIEVAGSSLHYNLAQYGSYVPDGWYIGCYSDHVLDLLFTLFQAFRVANPDGKSFEPFAHAWIQGVDFSEQDYARAHVLHIALEVNKQMQLFLNTRQRSLSKTPPTFYNRFMCKPRFKSLKWSWFKRLFESTSQPLLAFLAFMISPVVPSIWTYIIKPIVQGKPASMPILSISPTNWILFILLFILFLGMKIRVAWRKITYDPNIATHYQTIWDEMISARKECAELLLDIENRNILLNIDQNRKEFAEKEECFANTIDPILDVLDDLGFYESGDQVSAEVIHHHFYPWISTYYQATKTYLIEKSKDHAHWEKLEEIFYKTKQIEEKIKKKRGIKNWREKNQSLGSPELDKDLNMEKKLPLPNHLGRAEQVPPLPPP